MKQLFPRWWETYSVHRLRMSFHCIVRHLWCTGTWCSLSSSCFCCGEGCVMPDRVWICAPTNCRCCCCSAVKQWMGIWGLTTPGEVLTGGTVNWCWAAVAAGGLGDWDTGGISCWKGAGWEGGLGWGWTWMCACCAWVCCGWPCVAVWGGSVIWLWIIKSGGWDEGVPEREGVWDCGWAEWGCCCCWCGDWICWLNVTGDWEGWGLSATGGAGVWVVKAGEGDMPWILIGCLCPLEGTWRSRVTVYQYGYTTIFKCRSLTPTQIILHAHSIKTTQCDCDTMLRKLREA